MREPYILTERFWSKVDRRGPDECWPWLAGTDEDGYGKFQVESTTTARAHKLALESRLGRRLEVDECARHTCNFVLCCNPAHLIPGSWVENREDCVRGGRQARGERNANARFTADQVRALRARLAAGESPTALAREHGVRKFAIEQIRDRQTWRHVV